MLNEQPGGGVRGGGKEGVEIVLLLSLLLLLTAVQDIYIYTYATILKSMHRA